MPQHPKGPRTKRAVRRNVLTWVTQGDFGQLLRKPLAADEVSIAEDGSLDRVELRIDAFYACGHPAQLECGGRCSEPDCWQISCRACHATCAACHRPLCPEHAIDVQATNGATARLCRRHYDQYRRRCRRETALRFLTGMR